MLIPDKLILVADDQMNVVNLLRFVIEKEGYRLQIAMDGQEALDKARQFHPDMILLDIMMPKKDGLEVIAELKDSPDTRDIPVVFLTAKWTRDDKLKGTSLGAVRYLVKPFPIKTIVDTIREILGE
jgi:CheY-like chemotaxis protein